MSQHYPSLYLHQSDDTEGIDAQNVYNHCVLNNLHSLKTSAQLKEFIEREDINSICEEELNNLRSVASKIGVKETRAIYRNSHDILDSIN